MTFRVGMKVTLKDEVPWAKSVFGGEIYPAFGAVYTIRSIRPEGSDVFLLLDEIRNKARQWARGGYGEADFDAAEFRPVISPGISFDTSIPADPDSEQYDNRRRIPVPEWGASA